eukprot:CCRYP_011397-RA/>CCRYP_011397-RA protein AED:0.44 eAED:0.44 QI:0/0/0/1/0/0/2/0/172
MQTLMAFLMTRVKKPHEDDWGKLKQIMKYLKGTKHMKLTLSVNGISTIRWWVDSSYNVHDDCRGQTGAMMSLSGGAPISMSRKQKLTCKRVRDAAWNKISSIKTTNRPFFLRTTEDGQAQKERSILSQGIFIKDCVDRGDMSIKYQPTHKMYSNVLTKLKQGKAFHEDRAIC